MSEKETLPPRPQPRVIALMRVSTEGQAHDDRAGLPRQEDAINLTIKRCELDCVDKVVLKGVSGTEVRQNPQVIGILTKIASKEIDGIVVADIDRLMRPVRGEDYALMDVFIDAKATIYTAGMSFDFKHPTGKLMLQSLLNFAGFDREMTLIKTQDSIKKLCRRGHHPFGQNLLPCGITYDQKTKQWGINDKILPVLEAFRLVDEEGVHNLAEVARRTGIKERALHNLIRNALYAGWRIHDKGREPKKTVSKTGRAYKRKVPLPEADIIKVEVFKDPPVSMERFTRVQDILKATYKAWKAQRADRPAYNLLRSVARCAGCGSRFYFSQDLRGPKPRGYYYCAKDYNKNGQSKKCSCGEANQRKDDLDAATSEFVNKILTDPKNLREIVIHTLQIRAANRPQPAMIKTVPANFDARRKKAKKAYMEGSFTEADLKEWLAAIDDEEESLKNVCISQAKTIQPSNVENLIRCIVRGAYAFKRSEDPVWRFRIIQQLFSAIYYSGGQVRKFQLKPGVFPKGICEEDVHRQSPRPASSSINSSGRHPFNFGANYHPRHWATFHVQCLLRPGCPTKSQFRPFI